MDTDSASGSVTEVHGAAAESQNGRTTLLVVLLSLVVAALFGGGYWLASSSAPELLVNSAEWPEYLQNIDARLQKINEPRCRLEVLLLSGRPIGILSTFRARIEDTSSGEVMNVLRADMGLHGVEYGSAIGRLENTPGPDWWPKYSKQIQYFVCDEIHKGVEAHRAVVAFNPTTRMVYIEYSFDF